MQEEREGNTADMTLNYVRHCLSHICINARLACLEGDA